MISIIQIAEILLKYILETHLIYMHSELHGKYNYICNVMADFRIPCLMSISSSV